jgi:hypothetical protein
MFRPTNRYRDLVIRELHGNDSYEHPNGLTEVELLPDLSPEHVLATAGITWEEFCRFFRDGKKIVWMGPGVFFYHVYYSRPEYRVVVQLGSRNHHLVVYGAEPETAAATTAAAAATCEFLVRLLATRKEGNTYIEGFGSISVPISGPDLFNFFQESHANLRKATLKDMILNEEQIRALAMTEFRPGMEVFLHCCSLSDDNAAFVECLHRDRGPTQLNYCNSIDCHVLAAALEGNIRVTRLMLADHS